MASGTIYGTTSNSSIQARIKWTSTTNVAANTSTVTATLAYKKTSTYANATYSTTFDGSITINGDKKTINKYSANRIYLYTDAGWVTMASHSVTVNHDSNGSKTIEIKATGGMSGTSFTTTTLKESVSLDTIPRASSIESAANVTLGGKCAIKWKVLSDQFEYKVKLVCGSTSYITPEAIWPGDDKEYTYSDTMSVSYWAKAMPKAYSGTCTATLYTYKKSSDILIGSATKTFTLTLPTASAKPTVTFANPTLVDGWNGLYVQGRSKCSLSAAFAAGTGSSIKSCSISGTGLSKTGTGTSLSGTTSVLTASGTITYTASVTDTRGATATVTKQIQVQPYAAPAIKSFGAQRTSGGNVKISYGASCSSLSSKNSLKEIKIYYKKSTVSTWSSTSSVSLSGTSKTGSTTLSNFDAASSYDFKAVVTDLYGRSSTDALASVSSEFRIVNINPTGKGLAIGKMSEANDFDCSLHAKFRQGIEFTNDNGTIYGSLLVDYNENGNNIVYLRNGQTVAGGDTMGLAIHTQSVYVQGEKNNGLVSLGYGSRKWNQLYAANGTIATSDRKYKTNIVDMSDTQEHLFNKLKPVTFKFTNGTSDRTHYGFISQDIENSLEELELTGKDFAGFCKDLRVGENGNPILDEDNNKIYDYSLRYSEFIALNTYMIQKLQAENKKLKAELQELKEMIMNGNTSSNNVE